MLSCILNSKPKLPTMIMKIFKLHILILENVKDNYVKKFGDFSSKDFKQCYIPCVCLLYMQCICLLYTHTYSLNIVFSGDSDGEELAFNTGDLGSIPMLGSSPREGNGNPLQDSCQETPMDRGSWWDIVHGVTKNQLDMTE